MNKRKMLALAVVWGAASVAVSLFVGRVMSLSSEDDGPMESNSGSADERDTNADKRAYEEQQSDYHELEAPEEIKVDDSIIIGDGDGEISRHSEEYRKLIGEAYGRSLMDDTYTLTLYGKVHGLGARGVSVEDYQGRKGYVYDTVAIEKLRRKMLVQQSED